jgi:hypothetical protein
MRQDFKEVKHELFTMRIKAFNDKDWAKYKNCISNAQNIYNQRLLALWTIANDYMSISEELGRK